MSLRTWSAEDGGMTVEEVMMALNDHDGLVGVVIPE